MSTNKSKKKKKPKLLSFAILTCGIHEHLLKTSFWSQECGNAMPGQDLTDINEYLLKYLTITNC